MNEQTYLAPGELPPRIYEYVLAGLLLAGMAAAVTGYHAYHGFVTEEIARDRAYWGIGLPFIGLAGGLYLFSYGWQRGDVEKAARMAMWLTLGAAAFIAVVIGTLALKRSLKTGKGLGLLGFGSSGDDDRDGWYAGNGTENYRDSRPIFARRTPGMTGGIEIHCTHCGDMFVPQAP